MNHIAQGNYPSKENEIAVSSSLKKSASLSLNETIHLLCPNGKSMRLLIVGFFDDTQAARLMTGTEQVAVSYTHLLRAQQGHQERGNEQADARFCARTVHHALL